MNSTLPPTVHPTETWSKQFSLIPSPVGSPQFVPRTSQTSAVLQMDVLTVPADRQKGWYLSLMAPNTKGPAFAWLDPSRLYCNPQVWGQRILCLQLHNRVHTLHGVYLPSLLLIQALADCVKDLLSPFHSDTIDLVAGIDAMGFILGENKQSSLSSEGKNIQFKAITLQANLI